MENELVQMTQLVREARLSVTALLGCAELVLEEGVVLGADNGEVVAHGDRGTGLTICDQRKGGELSPWMPKSRDDKQRRYGSCYKQVRRGSSLHGRAAAAAPDLGGVGEKYSGRKFNPLHLEILLQTGLA